MSDEHRKHLDEVVAIERELASDAHRGQLVARLSLLQAWLAADFEDRILRIVGTVLLEHDQADLFEEIFARCRAGSVVQPGDGRRFLFRP